MDPDRWREVTRIYAAVANRPADQRRAALAAACGDDEALRREVESLLDDPSAPMVFDRRLPDVIGSVMTRAAAPPAAQIGTFRIEGLLGVGGMGEVYRARDTKLNRDVAIKILPAAFASDPDRLARFKREAQVLASLNHPNIAAIYGVEDTDDVHALVLELVEGPTLADRIASSKVEGRPSARAQGGIPLDEALPIARQIAEALEAAHEQGIVHRDLKPANIKVREDGTVKVLDFGLAKAIERVGAPNLESPTSNLSASPTITSPVMLTGVGVLLGTAAYMSPEQAKGKPADKRSDIWAFGCVLYEMLTGRRAFDPSTGSGSSRAESREEGEDVSDTLANILKTDPDWQVLPAATPTAIRRVLSRCLQKDRKRRLADIADARLELDESSTPSEVESMVRSLPAASRGTRIAATVFAVLATAIVTSVAWWSTRPPVRTPVVGRFTVPLGQGEPVSIMTSPVLALSPAGDRLVYVANGRLYGRDLADLESRPIPGSEEGNISSPVFSPDGDWIAYMVMAPTGGSIKKISVAGGAATTLCDANARAGMSWGPNGILFADRDRGIFRIPPGGGNPERLVKPGQNELVRAPQLLPDGDHLLFTAATLTTGLDGAGADLEGVLLDTWDRARIVVQSLKTGQRTTLVDGGSDARYLSSGHLLYARGASMFAVPFDVRQLTVTGDPVPAIEGVRRNIGPPSWGAAHVAFSDAGAMAYVPGPTSPVTAQQLFVVDRHGTMEPLKLSAGPYLTPRLSPDGRQLAYATDDGKEANVWIFDLSGTSAPRQLTFGGKDRYPVWSNSGEYVAYASERDGDAGIFRLRADGATAPERLTRAESATLHVPESWSPDGKTLLFTSTKDGASQLMMLSIADRKTSRFADVQSLVPTAAAFSPDGRWVTYTVRDQAHDNPAIYVKRFPPTEATYLITPNGFRSTWSPDGKELFFARRSQSFVVNVATSQTVVAGNPEQLPIRRFPPPGLAEREYDVLPDAQHFIFALPAEAQAGGISDTIEVVLNWSEELNRRVHQ